jgi:hypothetical protein
MNDNPYAGRQIGKTHAQILSMKAKLILGHTVFVPTNTPAFFLSRLRAEGIDAKATAQYATGGLIQEFEDGQLVNVIPGQKKFTGYLFEIV